MAPTYKCANARARESYPHAHVRHVHDSRITGSFDDPVPATMHLFCPNCANLLVVEEGPQSFRFACNTCPYVQNIDRKV